MVTELQQKPSSMQAADNTDLVQMLRDIRRLSGSVAALQDKVLRYLEDNLGQAR